ncbi:hypothetical protein KUTeg_022178 [Tegillarca granosa]|uniref:Uncharacterized protein n=1 Tax=Tegillarca granosa TaxID=220873 RepID=A0ABQ9E8F0_TEGGR|nr:hypothetical protein KUTeg_022178 [Tegillarca granosa]
MIFKEYIRSLNPTSLVNCDYNRVSTEKDKISGYAMQCSRSVPYHVPCREVLYICVMILQTELAVLILMIVISQWFCLRIFLLNLVLYKFMRTMGQSPVLTFLGLEIDTIEMYVRILAENVALLIIHCWNYKYKKSLERNCNLLQVFYIFLQGLYFLLSAQYTFYYAVIGLSKPFQRIRAQGLQLFTDSAGSQFGCGAVLKSPWSYFSWPKSWQSNSILCDLVFTCEFKSEQIAETFNEIADAFFDRNEQDSMN